MERELDFERRRLPEASGAEIVSWYKTLAMPVLMGDKKKVNLISNWFSEDPGPLGEDRKPLRAVKIKSEGWRLVAADKWKKGFELFMESIGCDFGEEIDLFFGGSPTSNDLRVIAIFSTSEPDVFIVKAEDFSPEDGGQTLLGFELVRARKEGVRENLSLA